MTDRDAHARDVAERIHNSGQNVAEVCVQLTVAGIENDVVLIFVPLTDFRRSSHCTVCGTLPGNKLRNIIREVLALLQIPGCDFNVIDNPFSDRLDDGADIPIDAAANPECQFVGGRQGGPCDRARVLKGNQPTGRVVTHLCGNGDVLRSLNHFMPIKDTVHQKNMFIVIRCGVHSVRHRTFLIVHQICCCRIKQNLADCSEVRTITELEPRLSDEDASTAVSEEEHIPNLILRIYETSDLIGNLLAGVGVGSCGRVPVNQVGRCRRTSGLQRCRDGFGIVLRPVTLAEFISKTQRLAALSFKSMHDNQERRPQDGDRLPIDFLIKQLIGSRATVQLVLAVAAIQQVVTCSANQDVVLSLAVKSCRHRDDCTGVVGQVDLVIAVSGEDINSVDSVSTVRADPAGSVVDLKTRR